MDYEYECSDCNYRYSTGWDDEPSECPKCNSRDRISVEEADRLIAEAIEESLREDERLFGRRNQWY